MFAADLTAPNMLWGQVVRSAHPHAAINAIDTTAALASPGVVRVLTAADVPGDINFGVVVPHQPVLCQDRVRYMGDGVALVLAETREQAAAAARLVKVDYTPLPAVFDMDEALDPGAPQIHSDYPGNIVVHHRVRRGDLEAGFAAADMVKSVVTDSKIRFDWMFYVGIVVLIVGWWFLLAGYGKETRARYVDCPACGVLNDVDATNWRRTGSGGSLPVGSSLDRASDGAPRI